MATYGHTPCSRVQGGLAVGVAGDQLAVDDAGPAGGARTAAMVGKPEACSDARSANPLRRGARQNRAQRNPTTVPLRQRNNRWGPVPGSGGPTVFLCDLVVAQRKRRGRAECFCL
jgi:hypothetical protein